MKRILKRILLGLFCALFLCGFGPLPTVSAHWWWPHHGSHSKSANVSPTPKIKKSKKSLFHHEKLSRGNSDPLYTSPRSVGWWHKTPGPMGAGAK